MQTTTMKKLQHVPFMDSKAVEKLLRETVGSGPIHTETKRQCSKKIWLRTVTSPSSIKESLCCGLKQWDRKHNTAASDLEKDCTSAEYNRLSWQEPGRRKHSKLAQSTLYASMKFTQGNFLVLLMTPKIIKM
jgi:hypothetical protein